MTSMTFKKSMLSVLTGCLLTSTCLAGRDDKTVGSSVATKLQCDPLPADSQVVRPTLSTPVSSLMNLGPLYQRGLSGKGQVAGIIENGPIHIPESLRNNIPIETKGYKNNDHASMVAQVVASRVETIGLARGAKIIFGSDQSKMNNQIAVTLEDAVKLAIRNGAKALNFSFKLYSTTEWKKENTDQETADHDFTLAIGYALKKRVPVFISGGNAQQDFAKTLFLKDLLKYAGLHGEDLLVIATAFDYPDDVSSRKDMFFAEHSARPNIDKVKTRKFALTGPYKVKVLLHKTIKKRKEDLFDFRKRFDAEECREMWLKDLSSLLETLSEDIVGKDVSLIRTKIENFSELFKEDKSLLMTPEDCVFFLDQSQRTDLPRDLISQLKSMGENFLSLCHDLVTNDITSPSSIPIEEQKRLEEKRRNIKTPASSNYNPAKVNGEFEKYIMDIQEDERPAEHSFFLETVQGTSFASPALMSVFLLLNEYNEVEGNLLKASDIIRCLRATAWQKPYAEGNENLDWYGCGVVDGGKALEACQLLVNARRAHKEGSFEESLKNWESFLRMTSLHAKEKYIFEIAETFKSQNSYISLNLSEKEKVLNVFYHDFLKLYPSASENQLRDRVWAFMLYESRADNESLRSLRQLLSQGAKEGLPGDPLLTLLPKSLYKEEHSSLNNFFSALKAFDRWYSSFTEAELKDVSSYTEADGKIFFSISSRTMRSRLPLDEREGNAILNNLIKEIEGGWIGYNQLNLSSVFQRMAGEKFLSTILTLSQKLEPFTLTSSQREMIDLNVNHAQVEKVKFEKSRSVVWCPATQ